MLTQNPKSHIQNICKTHHRIFLHKYFFHRIPQKSNPSYVHLMGHYGHQSLQVHNLSQIPPAFLVSVSEIRHAIGPRITTRKSFQPHREWSANTGSENGIYLLPLWRHIFPPHYDISSFQHKETFINDAHAYKLFNSYCFTGVSEIQHTIAPKTHSS